MSAPEIEFRRLTLEDGKKFSAFLGLCYGEGFFSRPELYKHWHFDNPAGESILYGAWDGDKLVGTNAVQKCFFRINGEKTLLAHSFSSATHPDYRLHLFKHAGKIETIYTRLNSLCREMINEGKIQGVYGFPNENAIKPVVKFAHYRQIGALNISIDVFRLAEILAMKRPHYSRSFCRVMTCLPQLLVSARSLLRAGPKGGFQVSFAEHFDEQWDSLALEASQYYSVIQERNAAFLRWRFVDFPVLNYRVLEARKDGKLHGYLVYVVYPWPEREKHRILAGYVVDFLVLPNEDGKAALYHLLYRARREFIREKAVIATSIHHVPEYFKSTFFRAGFIVAPKRIAPRPIYFVNRAEDAIDPVSVDPFSNWENWYINLADSDII